MNETTFGHPLDPAAVAQAGHRTPGPIRKRILEKRLQEAENLQAEPHRLTALIALLEARERRDAEAEGLRRTHRPGVQWSGQAVLDASGVWDHSIGDTSYAAFITNLGPQVTVLAGQRADSAPGAGPGVFTVPMGAAMVLNAATKAWSIYGQPGTILDVQLWGRALPPFAGQITPIPMGAQVLDGEASVAATQVATTFLTVPAGRVWSGEIALQCAAQEAAAGVVAAQATGIISVANATAPTGTVLRCDALVGANAATGLTGSDGSASNASPLIVVAGNQPALVQLATTVAGTAGEVNASAVGILL